MCTYIFSSSDLENLECFLVSVILFCFFYLASNVITFRGKQTIKFSKHTAVWWRTSLQFFLTNEVFSFAWWLKEFWEQLCLLPQLYLKRLASSPKDSDPKQDSHVFGHSETVMKNCNTDVNTESVFSCPRLHGAKDQTRRWGMDRFVWSIKNESVLCSLVHRKGSREQESQGGGQQRSRGTGEEAASI